MFRRLMTLTAVLAAACSGARAEDDLLLHWPFDEGGGQVAGDASGNGFDGGRNVKKNKAQVVEISRQNFIDACGIVTNR